MQLTEVEQVFKDLKRDLAVRAICHSTAPRMEAHIFLTYCLQVTLKARLKPLAKGDSRDAMNANWHGLERIQKHPELAANLAKLAAS